MPTGHGTYDYMDPEAIRAATEEVKGNYWWLKLKETIVEGDILIAMVTALENEYD